MRNLKKFLALVLAMVMAFSLMLSASAANTAKDFDDAANITKEFVEATDVLTGMKVFQGDDDGTLRPGDTIIRAEVAALIYRLATGDVDDVRSGAYANFGNFEDVSESDWFAGYVGYCANAGYIKGHDGYFNPYDPVTGYETLAMILRAIGYDKNNEFTGSTWETTVSALATQLGILTNIKTTHYGNTLYLASRRDVVAELLFQADAKVPMVVYTPAFGYQQTGMSGGVVGSTTNPTLGNHIFGLSWNDNGILLGNQQTGESGSVMGYAGSQSRKVDGTSLSVAIPYTAYTWQTKYDVSSYPTIGAASGTDSSDAVLGNNVKYELETGIDLIGHRLKLWYDDGTGVVSNNKKHVFAYFDKATLTDVVAVADGTGTQTNPTAVSATSSNYANGGRNLFDLAKTSGFANINANTVTHYNNSFGKFGSDFSAAGIVGDGVAVNEANPIASPVRLYKLISNSSDKSLDAVIALNIESSQITESNNVNRVPTIGVPVTNAGSVDGDGTKVNAQLQTKFVDASANIKSVNGVQTGVIAQDALVGNSTKSLGNYEFGIHITGTSPRDVSPAEAAAIMGTGTETAYYLMNQVTAPVEGTVVAYNVNAGTVTLDNGTVLQRSKYYHTVVNYNTTAPISGAAPASVIPQGWVQGGTYWEEGYANVAYKFYLDHEGKYLGAERTYGATFLYGTYLDYSQATSTSTFNYYLTGVTMDGKIDTVQLKKYWDAGALTPTAGLKDINSTTALGAPFRDASNAGTANNGIGAGEYTGVAIQGETADPIINDPGTNRNEYLNNMRRLGIYAASVGDGTYDLDDDTTINGTVTTLGAVQVGATNRYFTEGTKFILVSGFGTDSVKAEVYNGISELKGSNSAAILNLDGVVGTDVTMTNILAGKTIDNMTYYTESPYTYAQSGATAMKIDTIILPKAAVTWTGGSGLYYVGDPNYTSINSWGTDAWKYNLYVNGELQQVWLTNSPTGTTGDATALTNDVFLQLKDTGKTANDGQPIYTAGNYASGTWTAGTYLTNQTLASLNSSVSYLTEVTYSAVTYDAQTATFTGTDSGLRRVAEADVVNLNAEENCVRRPGYGYIWPGIIDLATLNEAGSINPVTGRPLKVSAVVDSSNPLVVTYIYVCYDQTP